MQLGINKLVMVWIKAKYMHKYKDTSLMKIICFMYLNGCIHLSITVSVAQKEVRITLEDCNIRCTDRLF